MGVDREASSDDLKKAYRKLALKWHPDKNLENIDESTQQFRLVQQAYEVLSDPQERAWYDKHREAILRGGHGHGEDYNDDSLDVFKYFHSSCFKGFGDDTEGFYAVYNEVFRKLAEEDKPYLEDEDFKLYDFGNSLSIYEDVVKPFYDHWESYCTAKSYVWVEKYDTREAPERRVRRLMEAENKKLRDAARKERNEEIRTLVKFVKKRDKRVQEYKKKMEERAEEIKKKAQDQRQRHLHEGRKKLENYQEAEWSSATGLEDHYKALEAKYVEQFGDHHSDSENSNESVEKEDTYDNLFCVACDKMFKSEQSFKNHEKGKKHKDMVAIIKAHMEEEDEDYAEEGEKLNGLEEKYIIEEEEEESTPQKLSKKQKKKRKQQKNLAQGMDQSSEDVQQLNSNSKKDSVPSKSKSKRELRRERQNTDVVEQDSNDEETTELNTPIANGKEIECDVIDNIDKEVTNEEFNFDSKYADVIENSNEAEDICDRLFAQQIVNDVSDGDTDHIANQINAPGPSLCGETSQVQDSKKSKKKNKPDPNQKSGKCGICGAHFPSRSKLFEHIQESGHALVKGTHTEYIDTATKKQGRKKKGK